jgi:hypothetical protein
VSVINTDVVGRDMAIQEEHSQQDKELLHDSTTISFLRGGKITDLLGEVLLYISISLPRKKH